MTKKKPVAKATTMKPVAKRKVAAAKPTTEKQPVASEKKAALQQQIEALQTQMEALSQEAIHELKLKLSDARKLVQTLEAELAGMTGAPRTKRVRRPSITDEALKDQVLKVMAQDGKAGMNAKQLADKLEVDALRIRKFIKDHPKLLKRTGAAAGTKFFLQ